MEKFVINLDDEVYTCLACEHKHATVENLMDHIRRVHANRRVQTRIEPRGPEVFQQDSDSAVETSSENSSDSSDDEVQKAKPAVSRQPTKRKSKSVNARELPLPSQSKRKSSILSSEEDSSQSEKGNASI